MVQTISDQRGVLAPDTQLILDGAQLEAIHMQAPKYHPEHMLLSLLKIDDATTASVFSLLGMDIRSLRQAATEIVQKHELSEKRKRQAQKIPPSKESLECLYWACSFAEQRRVSVIQVEHILLSVLRHPQIQPFLSLLFAYDEVTPVYLTEENGQTYTNAMDQLIQIKIRGHKRLGKDISELSLLTCERPTVTFMDIMGASAIKQELRPLISYIRRPQLYQRMRCTALEETLMIGHPCTERTLLVHAIAGEAIVSLVSLSLSKLVELMNSMQSGSIDPGTVEWLEEEYPLFRRDDTVQAGRSILHAAFAMAKSWAPCLLHLDDLDALAHLDNGTARCALQRRLLAELDALDWKQTMAVVATAYKIEQLDPELLQAGHFEHRIIMSESYAIHPAAQTKLCLACKHEVLATWHYCIYCGALLTKACPNCGSPHIEVEGARYCFSCGNGVWTS
jgi:SpoVK/Ycf46/Vps4 family AAA+-type ATPase